MFILKLEASKLDAKLKEMLRRTSDLTPAMQGSLDVVQESVLDEFQGSYYRSPSGAKIPWVKRKREPNPAGKGKILWNRGRLKSAMTGGAGSKTKVSKKSFMYGIDENMGFPGREVWEVESHLWHHRRRASWGFGCQAQHQPDRFQEHPSSALRRDEYPAQAGYRRRGQGLRPVAPEAGS